MLQPKSQSALQVQRSAPTGGLNVKNSYADMPITDAVQLDNFFPTAGGCKLRPGHKKWAQVPGVNGALAQTLLVYNSPLTDNTALVRNNKLLACVPVSGGHSIFDVSYENAAPSTVVTGLSNSQWQWINFSNSAGVWLYAVNGVDQPVVYNAGIVTRPTNTAGAYQITGTGFSSVNNLINICSHKQRIWFVEKDTTKGWYLAPNAVYGTATQFDFGPLMQRGGYLKALCNWTLDGGRGVDDHLVAISSQGEAIVYAGTDPSNTSTWSLVGVFYIGAPIGYKCFEKIDGDLAILTQFGLVPLSKALTSTQVNGSSEAFTDKIQLLISQLISENAQAYGWQILSLPQQNMLLINIPRIDGTFEIYAMNTTLGSWCRFINMNTPCLANYYEDLYIAESDSSATSYVYHALVGIMDDVELDGSGGTAVVGTAQQAYDYIEDPASFKLATLVKPIFISGAAIKYNANVLGDYDFIDSTFVPDLSPSVGVNSLWGVSTWDVSLWSDENTVVKNFKGANGTGFALSNIFTVAAKTPVTWVATSIIGEKGGMLG